MNYYLGFDLGGTKVAVGVVDAEGRVLSHVRGATQELRKSGDPFGSMLDLGRSALGAAGPEMRGATLAGVGIGLPGPADPNGIRMLAAPTIPEIEGISLQPLLEAAFDCSAWGENDANACALAEARFGAGKGAVLVVYMTVSTGIGGGIVDQGRVFRGAHGTSGEFGHQVVQPIAGPPCDCGGSGCLEALASGRGIARRARLAYGEAGGLLENDVERISAEWVANRVRAGDPVACRVWNETLGLLSAGVSNVINLIDPDVVIMGGGVSSGAQDLIFEPLRALVAQRCMPSLARGTPIVPAALGPEVGIVGAACLAMDV